MKDPGSRAARLAVAYKLIDAAHARRRAVNPHTWSPWVRADAVFHKGKLLERPADTTLRRRNRGRLKHPGPQVLTISPLMSSWTLGRG